MIVLLVSRCEGLFLRYSLPRWSSEIYAASLEICAISSLLSIAFHPSGTLTAAVLYHFMLSIYEQSNQGKGTRSRILAVLTETDGLTRNELVERSGLTYEQVRRQTHNLSISGMIESRLVDRERRYFIRRVKVNGSTAIFLSALLIVWLPVLVAPVGEDDIRNNRQNLTSS